MAFANGEVVRCIDPAAYARVQATLACCDGSEFTGRADDSGPDKHRRPFIVVDVIPKSDTLRHPELILLISVSTGLPNVGGQASFLMVINYLCCDPQSIPYKIGSYIVYGLGVVAKEADIEHVWSRQTPGGAFQKVSLNNLPQWDQKIHDVAMKKAWAGNEHQPVQKWLDAKKVARKKRDPSHPDLTPVK